jgi:microcystin-dependent protein
MSFYKWSKVEGDNANADSTIQWPEGMPPAGVNNSARAMMAALAKYRDDVAGALLTTNTASAYVLATNQQFSSLALMDGDQVAFTPHLTNAAGATLNVDGLGAKALLAGGVAVTAGQLIAGTPYLAQYNNASNSWRMCNVYGLPASALPIGAITHYSGATAPNSNYAICNGQAISRTTFATLFALVGTTYGVGNGSTTFNIPDLRGRVIAGLDANEPTSTFGAGLTNRINSTAAGGLNTDTGNIKGDALASAAGSQFHTQITTEVGTHGHGDTISFSDTGHTHPNPAAGSFVISGAALPRIGTGLGADATATGSGTANLSKTGSVTNFTNSAAMAWLQPTIIMPYIIRVL